MVPTPVVMVTSPELISGLPLKFALDALCRHKFIRDFPAEESVHKLFSLFHLQELKEPLDTIKLLASRTKQAINIGVWCVEEWNLVKLAALLMVASDKLVIDNDLYCSPIPMLIGLQHGLESHLEKKQVTRSMWQAYRFVERSTNFLKENRTTLMVEDEVVPCDVAYKFLTEVKLHDKGTHMVSADLDRFAAELLQRSGGFLDTSLTEKKCLKSPSTATRRKRGNRSENKEKRRRNEVEEKSAGLPAGPHPAAAWAAGRYPQVKSQSQMVKKRARGIPSRVAGSRPSWLGAPLLIGN